MVALREGRFFDAHEEWETVWIRSTGPDRRYLQGLIQLAAAGVHVRRGRRDPALRLLTLATEKLGDAPADFRGIPASLLRSLAARLRSDLEEGHMPGDSEDLFSVPCPP